MWAIRGRLVPLSSDPAVAPDEAAVFKGRVWLGDDGTIIAVTKGSKPGPPGSEVAPVIDAGRSLVMPGLVDLHNHFAYNTLPLWTEPGQQTPFALHNSWTRAESYAASTTWTAYALITACPEELLACVEAKAIVGGTASIQGSPPKNRPRDGWLVRNMTMRPSARTMPIDLRLGAHCKTGGSGRASQQDASRLCLHLPLFRRPARQHRGA